MTISPDGTRLAFVPIEAGREGLRLKNLETNEQVQLLEPQERLCWGFRFTHDGQSLYLNTTEPNSTISVLYRINARSGEPPQKISVNVDSQISLSPDGLERRRPQRVLYRRYKGITGYSTLACRQQQGLPGTPEQLTQDSIIIRPVVSPDGKSIACTFRKEEADKWKIAILPFAGGEPLQVLNIPRPYNQIVRWTHDSKALFYLDEKNGVSNIWKQPLDGSPPKQITQFTEDVIYHYDRFGAGESFVLTRGRTMRDIVLIRNP